MILPERGWLTSSRFSIKILCWLLSCACIHLSVNKASPRRSLAAAEALFEKPAGSAKKKPRQSLAVKRSPTKEYLDIHFPGAYASIPLARSSLWQAA